MTHYCVESLQAFFGNICDEINIKSKYLKALRDERDNADSDKGSLTPLQLNAFKNLLDEEWKQKRGAYKIFKLYSKEGVEILEQDLIFIRPKDVIYLDLCSNDFNYGQILDQFKVLEKIGQGGFGSVYRIREKHSGKFYAMKTIQTDSYLNKASKIEELFREQNTLKQLDHKHIIRLHHAFQVKDNICLIMDLAVGGEFQQYLINKPHRRVDEKEGRHFMYQIWRAISFWHSKGIIHRDLKPENILVDYASDERDQDILFDNPLEDQEPYQDVILKITDFGISGIKRSGNIGELSTAGTCKFMAPEIHTGSDTSATKALDIWALGVILYLIIFAEHPFYEKPKEKWIKNIIEKKVKFPSGIPVSSELKDLIKSMLCKDPKRRIDMFRILNHPWFEIVENVIKVEPLDKSVLTEDKKYDTKLKGTQILKFI
jgi:serine/threonine protein kinase